jgi:hypothetical protein
MREIESLVRGSAPIAKVRNGTIAGAATAVALTAIQAIFKIKFSTEMEVNLSILGIAMCPVISNYIASYRTKLSRREITPNALAYTPLSTEPPHAQ